MQRIAIQTLRCTRCQHEYAVEEMPAGCPLCFERGLPSAVSPEFALDTLAGSDLVEEWDRSEARLWRFHQLLPVSYETRVTLAEGDTPLLPMRRLQDRLRLGELWIKDERRNPTGSFKDRFFSVCLTRAREVGAQEVVIASSGNGGVSAAAYAAAAGLRCVVITTPKITTAWRAAIATTGATLIATAADAERWEVLRLGVEELGWYCLTNYVSPPVGSNWYGIEGYKSIAYETAEALNWRAPDWMVVPTSRGDALSGIWRGFQDLYALGLISSLPRVAAVERFPSLSVAWQEQLDKPPEVETQPTTAASIGSDVATYQSLDVVRQSNGVAIPCSDDDLLEMITEAGRAGIFAEVSATAGLVGTKWLAESGYTNSQSVVVSVVTATGYTDPQSISDGLGMQSLEPISSVTIPEILAAVHESESTSRRGADD